MKVCAQYKGKRTCRISNFCGLLYKQKMIGIPSTSLNNFQKDLNRAVIITQLQSKNSASDKYNEWQVER